MALRAVRNIYGGAIPVMSGTAKGAYVKGCPVYRNISDGKLTTMATDGTKIIGFLNEATSADGDTVHYTPCYPGIQFLLDFAGTYAITKLGTYVSLNVASGVPTADVDDAGNDSLKLEELYGTDTTSGVAWFSAAASANQTVIEVA